MIVFNYLASAAMCCMLLCGCFCNVADKSGKMPVTAATVRNDLVSYYDAAGKKKVGKYDLTSYFTNWSTEEVTVRINIDATDDSVTLEGWEMGDTTDYIFNFGEAN